MGIGKGLVGVLIGALAVGGCSKDHSEYGYEGEIGEDYVKFEEKSHGPSDDDNILTVTKSDGRIMKYMDSMGEDLKLEYVEITENGKTTRYEKDDEVGKPVVAEAQKLFDDYLEKIVGAKAEDRKALSNKGLESLK